MAAGDTRINTSVNKMSSIVPGSKKAKTIVGAIWGSELFPTGIQ